MNRRRKASASSSTKQRDVYTSLFNRYPDTVEPCATKQLTQQLETTITRRKLSFFQAWLSSLVKDIARPVWNSPALLYARLDSLDPQLRFTASSGVL